MRALCPKIHSPKHPSPFVPPVAFPTASLILAVLLHGVGLLCFLGSSYFKMHEELWALPELLPHGSTAQSSILAQRNPEGSLDLRLPVVDPSPCDVAFWESRGLGPNRSVFGLVVELESLVICLLYQHPLQGVTNGSPHTTERSPLDTHWMLLIYGYLPRSTGYGLHQPRYRQPKRPGCAGPLAGGPSRLIS